MLLLPIGLYSLTEQFLKTFYGKKTRVFVKEPALSGDQANISLSFGTCRALGSIARFYI